MQEVEVLEVMVREYDASKDKVGVEEVERRCEVGPTGKISICTDLLGDPICRVRHSPAFLMLVAEMGEEIVGMVRGCIKTVTCGTKISRNHLNFNSDNLNDNNSGGRDSIIVKPLPVYTKAAYILGLRVSPSHRRKGIGLKLIRAMEEWFTEKGAEYSYMATENDNQASVQLFTRKCGYSKFRTPCILVNPVFAHRVGISKRVTIVALGTKEAETLYRSRFATTEFFPRDIDSVLKNKLNLGTFVAVPRGRCGEETWGGVERLIREPPESWGVVSVWNSKEVFKVEVRGAGGVRRALAKTTRLLDKGMPLLGIPSVPNMFKPFGFHFLYGLGGEGPAASKMIRALCAHAHNLGKAHSCGVVATEVGSCDPLKIGIPHWKLLSSPHDLWCIKRLGDHYSDGSLGDWTKSPSPLSIFVDPRDV